MADLFRLHGHLIDTSGGDAFCTRCGTRLLTVMQFDFDCPRRKDGS